MQAPKVVVFDLGKVLVDFDYSISSRRLAERSTAGLGEIKALIDSSALLFRFETGLLSAEQFYDAVCEGTGFAGDFAEFHSIFADIFTPMAEMIELHSSLRSRGVPTFIFSNTNEIAVSHIRRQFPFFSRFTGYILSYEHGAMKPETKLYEVVERVTGCRGTKILYLDDRPENIEAGARRGWQVILQEDPARSIDQIRQRGLLS